MGDKETVRTHHFDDRDAMDIYQWITFIRTNRRTLCGIISLSLVFGVIVAFIIPKQYTAVATILPPQVTDSNLSGMLGNLGGIAGDMLGTGDVMSKVYPNIAQSRYVLTNVLAASYHEKTFRDVLQEHYKFKEDIDDNIITELQKNVIDASVSTKTNIVTVSVTFRDPEIAADIANAMLNHMEAFFKYHFRSAASGQRAMIEQRLTEVSDSLNAAEDHLLKFRESNRTTGLSPSLQIYEGRLVRQVEINNILYIELMRQQEVAKIAELQMKPVINILDSAVPPIRKSKPSRAVIVLTFGMMGFISTFTYLKIYPHIMRATKQITIS